MMHYQAVRVVGSGQCRESPRAQGIYKGPKTSGFETCQRRLWQIFHMVVSQNPGTRMVPKIAG
jgi:hypothetical protein